MTKKGSGKEGLTMEQYLKRNAGNKPFTLPTPKDLKGLREAIEKTGPKTGLTGNVLTEEQIKKSRNQNGVTRRLN